MIFFREITEGCKKILLYKFIFHKVKIEKLNFQSIKLFKITVSNFFQF